MKFKDVIDKYKWDDVYSIFIGYCLWEMTFYGFTQEKIRKQLAQLEKEAEEAKKNPSSCIFPFAEETKSPPMPTANI